MERLTQRDKNNVAYWNGINGKSSSDIKGNIYGEAITKLAEYEDAEEQGLLLRLPFKIGQKVYYIYESCIDRSLMIGSMVFGYSCLDFPKTYYATKEEAEQKLKEMESD